MRVASVFDLFICTLLCGTSVAAEVPPAHGSCKVRQAIKLGQKAAITLADGRVLGWETSGPALTLRGSRSPKKTIVIQAGPPYNTQLDGDCLKSGSYIYLATSKKVADARYLIADARVDAAQVPIDPKYAPPFEPANFFIEKLPGSSVGEEIRTGDRFRIRGVAHDYWLVAPAGAAAGQKVLLSQDINQATAWTIAPEYSADGENNGQPNIPSPSPGY